MILFAGTVSLFVALFVGLFSYEILNLLSGSDKYLIKHNALALIFVTQLLILIGDYMPVGIDIKKKTFIGFFGIFFAITNIILNYFLIPIYMLEGAIISSILSMFGYILIINIVSYRLYK